MPAKVSAKIIIAAAIAAGLILAVIALGYLGKAVGFAIEGIYYWILLLLTVACPIIIRSVLIGGRRKNYNRLIYLSLVFFAGVLIFSRIFEVPIIGIILQVVGCFFILWRQL